MENKRLHKQTRCRIRQKSRPNIHFALALDTTNIQYSNIRYITGKHENICLYIGISIAQIFISKHYQAAQPYMTTIETTGQNNTGRSAAQIFFEVKC